MERPIQTTTAYVASVSTAMGGLFSLSNIALAFGIVTTAILFFMQARSTRKRDRLTEEQEKLTRLERAQAEELHRARMEKLSVSSKE